MCEIGVGTESEGDGDSSMAMSMTQCGREWKRTGRKERDGMEDGEGECGTETGRLCV